MRKKILVGRYVGFIDAKQVGRSERKYNKVNRDDFLKLNRMLFVKKVLCRMK